MADLDPLAGADPVAAILAEHRRPAGERRLLALHTSGTSTGVPRVIRRSTASWVESFPAFSSLTATDVTSRVWVPGPLTSTMNLFAATHAAWVGAGRVEDPAQATHAHLTTTALGHLVDSSAAVLDGLRVVVAGMPLPASLADRARAAGARVHHYYGAAELSFVAWGEHSDALRVFPGVEVRSRDGVLQARSPFVAATTLPDAEGWHTVGDLGTVTSSGSVTVFGRPGAVTTAGTTVQIGEIEAALRNDAPHGIVVTGEPHPRLGAVVTAWLTDAAALPALKATARRRLTPAAIPRQWHVLAAWPLTPHGKIDRSRLPR